jgi:hypothetical protein
MTRLLVLAEGDSEELFVQNILSPHLENFGVFVRATYGPECSRHVGLRTSAQPTAMPSIKRVTFICLHKTPVVEKFKTGQEELI